MNLLVNIKKQDWILNLAILFLAVAGLLSLFSSAKNLFYQQLVWYLIGIVILILASQIDWRPLINYPRLITGIYVLAICLLIFTYWLAPEIRSAKSWLVIGSLQFQTSDFAKFALIIIFSVFWAKAHIGIAHWGNLIKSFLYFLIPAALVAVQPDLGTVLILFGIWFGYLLVSGIRWRHLLAALVIFMIVGFFLWGSLVKIGPWQFKFGGVLEDYQKDRILSVFNPESDPLNRSYNVIQSKIAIGSAGFLGKGFGGGTQVQLGFLPEAQTDFIFAAFVEEWGLLGGLLVILAFVVLVARIIKLGLVGESNFFRLFCLGAVIMFALHFILNVGSNLGIVPVIGVSFPFLSYGGSNLLINFVLISIIQSFVTRSKF